MTAVEETQDLLEELARRGQAFAFLLPGEDELRWVTDPLFAPVGIHLWTLEEIATRHYQDRQLRRQKIQ